MEYNNDEDEDDIAEELAGAISKDTIKHQDNATTNAEDTSRSESPGRKGCVVRYGSQRGNRRCWFLQRHNCTIT